MGEYTRIPASAEITVDSSYQYSETEKQTIVVGEVAASENGGESIWRKSWNFSKWMGGKIFRGLERFGHATADFIGLTDHHFSDAMNLLREYQREQERLEAKLRAKQAQAADDQETGQVSSSSAAPIAVAEATTTTPEAAKEAQD